MICKKCGEELLIGVEICPKCGTVVERRKLTPESEARIRETMPDLKEALFNNKITSDTTLSDEVRIKAAVPILREILRLKFPKSQLCKECGHQNPSGVVNCVNCGCSLNSTEEAERGKGIAGALLGFVCKDMAGRGIDTLYLVTDHTSFYERYGWEFLCMVQGDDEPEMTRMYIHKTK